MPRGMNRRKLHYLRRLVHSAVIERKLLDHSADGPPRYFDRHGQPISMGRWAGIVECLPEHRLLRRTKLPSGYVVSTVWLGMDRGFSGRGPPVIFETMVFGLEHPRDLSGRGERQMRESLDMDRYCAETDAIAGHRAMVEKWLQPQPTQSEGEA